MPDGPRPADLVPSMPFELFMGSVAVRRFFNRVLEKGVIGSPHCVPFDSSPASTTPLPAPMRRSGRIVPAGTLLRRFRQEHRHESHEPDGRKIQVPLRERVQAETADVEGGQERHNDGEKEEAGRFVLPVGHGRLPAKTAATATTRSLLSQLMT